jgi:ribosomal protein S12 methylthiotransferase
VKSKGSSTKDRATSKPASKGKSSPRSQRVPAAPSIESVSLVSLGCPKNLVDSEKMLGLLAESGLAPISFDGESFGGADAVVVNTCGFLEASKDESLGVIKEAIQAKERGEVKRVVVAGCLVQRHRAAMLEWAPGIDAMIGVFDRDKIVEAVTGQTPTREAVNTADGPKYWIAANALVAAKQRGVETTGLTVNGKDGKGIGYFEDDSARLRLTPRHYAYLRISEGCNQNCAFCTIPSIRGKMRSKPIDRIVQETRELVNDGAFEILLIGQDTTSYGDDIGTGLKVKAASGAADFSDYGGLPTLLQAISDAMDDAGSQGWLRLMYAYPSNFSEPIIEAFAGLVKRGRLLPYLDIPLQHASDRVLSLMKRHVTSQKQADVLHRLRDKIPGFAVRTTFISGFPGETEQDHQELLKFVDEMKFEAVGVFEYSHEAGTVAGTMEEDPKLAVPPEVKARRRGEVMELQQKIAFARQKERASSFNESKPAGTGLRLNVLIDQALRMSSTATTGVTGGGKLYAGRTIFQAPQIDSVTYVQSKNKLVSGELVPCVIVGHDGYDLIARPVNEVEKRVGLSVLRS